MKVLKKLTAVFLAALILLSFAACAKKWTCDWCGKTWVGDAYYSDDVNDTLCEDCANQYWSPFPYKYYKK